MKRLKLIPRAIIKRSFDLSVRTIERNCDLGPCRSQLTTLRAMPAGTLGHDIACCLDSRKLRLVPHFESHDLKHVLLGYRMTPVHEIRMQAFMLGNGNYSVPCLAILLFGMLLLPGKLAVFLKDFKQGRRTAPISAWTIDEYASHQTAELRKAIYRPVIYTASIMTAQNLTRYGAIASVIAGAIGMMICLPFLFSSSVADLIGAGFPFIGGAILVVGGLIALSMSSGQQRTAAAVSKA